jgi:predicted transcriptional regulator
MSVLCHAMSTMARLKKMVSLALDPELLRRLEKWIAAQDVPPSKTAVHETALREFLEKRERRRG